MKKRFIEKQRRIRHNILLANCKFISVTFFISISKYVFDIKTVNYTLYFTSMR